SMTTICKLSWTCGAARPRPSYSNMVSTMSFISCWIRGEAISASDTGSATFRSTGCPIEATFKTAMLPPSLPVRIIDDFAEAAGPRHDVLLRIEAPLLRPFGARNLVENGRRAQAPIEPDRVNSELRVAGCDRLQVFRRDDEMERHVLASDAM